MRGFARSIRRGVALTIAFCATLTVLLIPSSSQAQQSPAASTPAPSLYEQLGRYDGVQRYVALVFPRVAQHPQLRRMFQGHGADSQQKQLQHVVELICNRTGGPCVYTGREMPTVHVGLGITSADWEVFMQIIDDGLEEMAASGAANARTSCPVPANVWSAWAERRTGRCSRRLPRA